MYSWINLSSLPIKPGKKIKLLNKFGSPEKVLKFLNRQREPELFKFIDKFNTPEEDLAILKRFHAGLLTYFDPDYPTLLKETFDPPVVLYYRGNLELLKEFGIAIVGTRKPTRYGLEVTEYFTRELVEKGMLWKPNETPVPPPPGLYADRSATDDLPCGDDPGIDRARVV